MKIRHLLFDLDGTLLPMKQDEFVAFYLPLLAGNSISGGISTDVRTFIGAVWKGYEAMVRNDGSCTNRERFWSCLKELLPLEGVDAEKLALNFYSGDFNRTIQVTSPSPLADQIVKTAKGKGISVYLATNPVFPRCATQNRIRWAGLEESDFRVITTYEDCCFCKPNPRYFQQLLEAFGMNPEECLMVGNDVEEDLAIRRLGVKTYLVTDTMENKKNLPIETEYQGSLAELLSFVEHLE
ncbi:MAG: HAD family hydrolase [Candidatus Limivivens sp.]|nr:HAD family hydrolase [Candidatus Limivivens sp.]